jgi:hypothetical protein
MAVASRSGIQVTLAAAGTKYQLSALLAAIDANAATKFRRLQLQSDPTNGAARVLVGDSNISTTRYGYKLLAGDFGPVYQDVVPSFPTQDMWLQADTNTTLVNVEGLA